MIRFFRELRLIPIVLIATACLLVLKTADLVLDNGYFVTADNAPTDDEDTSVVRTTPDVVQQVGSALSWARQMFNFPDGGSSTSESVISSIAPPPVDGDTADITGSVSTQAPKGDKAAPSAAAAAAAAPLGKGGSAAPPPPGTVIALNGPDHISGSERAILQRLQQRREELDQRARELDIRESLVKAAEKRMDSKLAELKEIEGKIATETQQKDQVENARLKGLVTMYENMKARDAAKIFDGLESGVLIEVASQINPRQMADILAQMSPQTAERLTVELASKAAQQPKSGGVAQLPKIEGQPTAP
jgi:flagellar motility protein MotE (MotC chaperone)